jgi:hypothetical protein
MAEPLPEAIDVEVARLFDEAEELFDREEDEQALARFRAAWGLIPEPKDHWQRALQVLGGIADCQFHLCDYEDCFQTLQLALRSDGVGPDNPWVCLRLGQCYVALGDERQACNWLLSAFVLGGKEMFENESDGYGCRDFLMQRVAPPAGGWPEGW